MNRYLHSFVFYFCTVAIVHALFLPPTSRAEEGNSTPSAESGDSQKNQETVLVTSYYEWVQALKKRDSITHMTLYSNCLTDEDAADLRLFSKLESLVFDGRINRNTVSNFIAIPQLKDLTLHLNECLHPSDIASLSKLKNLEQLCLMSNDFYSAGAEKWGTEDFAFIQALPQLKSLKMVLGLSQLKSELEFSFLENLTDLESLSIIILDSGNNTELFFANDSTEPDIYQSTEDEDDDLSSQVEYVFDFNDRQLNYLKNKTKLKNLTLLYGSFTDAGLKIISNFPHLETLNVLSDSVTGDFFLYFSQTPNLKKLSVSQCKQIPPFSLKNLSVLENLESLDISSCAQIDNAGMQYLRALTMLKELDISNLPLVSDEGISALEDLTKLESLRMCFTNCSFTAFDSINTIKTLKKLHVNTNNFIITPPQLGELNTEQAPTFDFISICALNNLEELSLYSIPVSLENYMEYLHCFPKLKELDLSQFSFVGSDDQDFNNKIYDSDLEIISHLTDLETLCLSGIASVTAEGIKHLFKLKKLNKLDLRDCDIDDEAAVELGKITSLEQLCLSRDSLFNNLMAQNGSSAGLSDEGLKYIGNLTNLRVLFLDGHELIYNEGMKHLTKLDKLEWLSLNSPYMNNDCLKYIAEMESLRAFQSYSGKYTYSGLEAFKNHARIESVELDITWDTDEKLKYLQCIGQCPEVKLSGAIGITDSGLESVGSMPYLTELFLDECSEITGAGFAHGFDKSPIYTIKFFACNSLTSEGLSQLKNLPRIRHLLFKNSDLLTDEILIGLKSCVQLEEIEVSDCPKVTGSFMDTLSKALPHCRIQQNADRE